MRKDRLVPHDINSRQQRAYFRTLLAFLFAVYLLALQTSLSGMEMMGWSVGILGAGYLLLQKDRDFTIPPLFWPLMGFVLIAGLGILLGDAPTQAKIYDLGRLRFLFLFLLLYWYLRNLAPPLEHWLPWATGISLMVSLYGIVQHFIPLDLVRPEGRKIIIYAFPDDKVGPLVLGTFNHHLTFAGVFLFYLCVLIGVGLYYRRLRWFLFIALPVSLAYFWTQSRTAWAVLPIVIWLLLWPKGRKKALLGGAVLLALSTAVILTQPQLRERVSRTFFSSEANYTYKPRTRLWAMQWRHFKEHPILGIGWNNNERFCSQYANQWGLTSFFCGHAHNNFFQVLATTGLAGTLLFLLFWVMVFRMLWFSHQRLPSGSLEKSLAWAILAAFVGFHLQGLTQWNFGDTEVLHQVIFFLALSELLRVKATAPANP